MILRLRHHFWSLPCIETTVKLLVAVALFFSTCTHKPVFATLLNANSLKWLSLATVDDPSKVLISATSLNNAETNSSDDYLQTGIIVDCGKLEGLSKRQRQICSSQPDLMPFIILGARMALAECQHQFRDRRWNCTLSDPQQRRMLTAILNQGTREAAFLHALASASVAHAITSACSKGVLSEHCSCDQTLRGQSAEGGFVWAGCSDNIEFGGHASREFVDAQDRVKKRNLYRSRNLAQIEKSPDQVPQKQEIVIKRILMNLHNHEVGRKTLSDTLQLNCKCHGVSGSCEVKTCWKSIAPFRTVGDVIKEKFDGATEVGRIRQEGKNFVLEAKNSQLKRHTTSDLVYVSPSPDFCERDDRFGSIGTHGRACNHTSRGVDSCDVMCCGRDYAIVKQRKITKCGCRFHWCCRVQCQECQIEVEEAVCT